MWPRPATALLMLGHATFLVLLAIEAPRHMTASAPPSAVEVVIVAPPESRLAPMATPRAAEATLRETVDERSAPPVHAARPSSDGRVASNGRVAATEYFAGAVLDDPRNRKPGRRLPRSAATNG